LGRLPAFSGSHQTGIILYANAFQSATLATLGESTFGLLLVLGLFTRAAAVGSGIQSFLFAFSNHIK